MNKNKINLIPLTDDEITTVQTTIVAKMLELNQDANSSDTTRANLASNEITELGSIVKKVARYCTAE